MIEGFCRLLADSVRSRQVLLWNPSARAIYSLVDTRRHCPGHVRVGQQNLRYCDSLSTFYQWIEIFRDRRFAFSPNNESPLIIDAGANIGMACLFWRKEFPTADIVAIEPNPAAFECLQANVGCVSRTTLIPKALATTAGKASLRLSNDDTSRIAVQPSTGTSLEVECATLSSILAACDRDVDLLKIDIEGMEVDVLWEASPHLHRVHRIFVEYHELVELPPRLPLLLTQLNKEGFTYVLDAARFVPHPFEEANAVDIKFVVNIFATRGKSC